METGPIIFNRESLITVVMPFFGYSDQCCSLLASLSKGVREIYHKNLDNFHRIFTKRELKCHYPLFEKIMGALEKNHRYAQFRIWLQVKMPKDFSKVEAFLKDHPQTEFSHLHLVVTEEALSSVNSLIDTMRDLGIINPTIDDSYHFLDCSNYCRAAEMKSKLRFETEMIIGAEPKAFIDKVEEIGLIDVRAISRCPVEEIDVPTYMIKADAEFATSFENGERNLTEVFSSSVKRCIFEDEIDKLAPNLISHIENVQKGFPGINSVWLELKGQEIKDDNLINILTHPEVKRVEYEGFEQEDTIVIKSTNLHVAVADGANVSIIRVKGSFSLEVAESEYSTSDEFVIINPAKINLTAVDIEQHGDKIFYENLNTTSYEGKKIILKKVFLHDLQFRSVPSCPPSIVPTQSLTMYLDEEKEEYDHLNNYLINDISDSIPVTLELDMAFPEDIELVKTVLSNFFKKNLTRLHIVMEMQDDEIIDHVYELTRNSTTLKELMPIFNQDCEKVIDLVKNTPQIEQYIIDMRRPFEEHKPLITELFQNDKNNRFVLRDVHEWLLEFRFPTSFELIPAL